MPDLWLKDKYIGSIKGVLFDKDGTLSDSESFLVNLAKQRVKRILCNTTNSTNQDLIKYNLKKAYGIENHFIDPNGIIAIASEEHNAIATATILSLAGENWPDAIQITKDSFKEASKKLQEDSALNENRRRLLPGAIKVLKALKDHGAINSLISNDSRNGIRDFLASNNINHIFSKFWSCEENPPKPDPDAVKGLCNMMNLHPSECALLGDADSDLTMAKDAGIGIVIGFTAGWTQKPELKAHDYLINNWNELTTQQKTKVT